MNSTLARWMGTAATTVLVVCALALTTVAIRREVARSRLNAPQVKGIAYTPVHVTNGRALIAGNRRGAAKAPITFVEFSDFQCPFCAALENTLTELRQRYPNEVAVVYRHYPSPAHAFAKDAAVASECAAEQGRFAEYAALLFQTQDSIGRVPWGQFARRAGVVDLTAFEGCRTSPATADRVAKDMSAGARLGISGTPALLLNDEMLIGAIPIDQLEAWMHSAGYTLASR